MPAHILGAHDFVSFTALQHTILMYAGFMGKGVGPDDGLVRLYRKSGNTGNKLRTIHDLCGIQCRITREHVLTCWHVEDAGVQFDWDVKEAGIGTAEQYRACAIEHG